ncbi:NAD(P)H-dependent oxidoreductase [soil metagenome]
MNVKVILSSTRQNRQGEKISGWVMQELIGSKNLNVELLDLREYELPYYDDPLPASLLKQPYLPEVRQKWAEKIKEADAFIIITPEYNHSYPAVLKSALDSIYSEWNNKAVAFISYGGSANGSRAVEHLRLVAIELQMAAIREGIHIGLFSGEQIFDEAGQMLVKSNTHKLQKLTDQLVWWGEALKIARDVKPLAK